jgi:quercetin dioxygenase-like cupin family protein
MGEANRKILDGEGYGLILNQTAEDTQGNLLEMEAFYRPQSEMPPLHYHPSQEETFQVLAGKFSVQVDGAEHLYQKGDSFTIPAGSVHGMHNSSSEKGHLLWQTRPALNSQGFFEKVWQKEIHHSSGKRNFADLLWLSVVFNHYEKEVRLAKPFQRIILQILSLLARMMGIKV